MSDLAPFAYTTLGNVFVLGDGPEVLVYSGNNDQGMWKVMTEDIVFGVGVSHDHVIALEGGGRLLWYRAIDGRPSGRIETETSPLGLEVSAEGFCAIATAQEVVFAQGGGREPWRIALSGPRHLAWAGASASVGVGCADGNFYVVDPQSASVIGSIALGGPVTGVAWRVQGQWAVAHDRRVDLVSGDGTAGVQVLEVGEPVGGVAVSADGAFLAVIVGDQQVRLFELASYLPVGEVVFQRKVYQVRFGPKHWLACSFDDGDANRIDLATGKVTRTQAHPGRAQNAWSIQPTLKMPQIRGAISAVAAGGAAIAKAGAPKATKKPARKIPWAIIGGVTALVFLLSLLCCGVLGVVAALQPELLW
jgi:hypothetical protein